MKFTDNFKLGSIEENMPLDPLEDARRFITIDRQLLGLFQVFGNGVVNGWNVTASSGLSVSISSGRGHISFISAETTSPSSVVDLIPNAVNFIYATNTTTTRYNRATLFTSETSRIQNNDTMVLLAAVTTSGGAVVKVDESVRNDIGFIETIKTIVNTHRHRGNDTDNPSRIDLSSEVMGLLPGSKIKELDASKITSGKIPLGRIPKLKHSDLIDKGVLTHAQLDSYVRNLSNDNARLLGELSTIDMIQLYLAHKHIWNEVDAYSSNMLLMIPGISPDGFIDRANTTAEIDTVNHKIEGETSISGAPLSTTFSTVSDFKSVKLLTRTIIGSDANGAYIKLDRPVSERLIESFDSNITDENQEYSKWKVETVSISDNSSFLSDKNSRADGAFSAKFNIDQGVRVQSTLEFDATESWASYSEIEISIKTISSEHGQIRFQILNDSNVIVDDFKLLDTNEITDGFNKIIRDITGITRTNIRTIRVYTDTTYGWDLSAFDFNIDKIKLNNNLYYNQSGRVRFRLSTPQKSQWSAISWINDEDNDGTVSVRARTAPSYESFDRSNSIPYSDYLLVSGAAPDVEDNRVIEIEVSLTSSPDKTVSPVFRSLTVSYITAAAESGITIDTATDFLRAKKLENAKVQDDGIVVINGRIDVGDVVYGQFTGLQQTSLTDDPVKQYGTPVVGITGSLLPLSPIQAVSVDRFRVPSIQMASSVERLKDRTYLVADTGNDRIILFDRNGKPSKILCSNNVVSESELFPVCSSYDKTTKTLYIAWSKPLLGNSLDLTNATIEGDGISIQLSNLTDTLVKLTGKTSDIQTANSTAIVLSSGHANQIIEFIGAANNVNLYLKVTTDFAKEKIAVSNEKYAKIKTSRGLPIFIGDLKFVAGIYRPISVALTQDGNYLIGNAKPISSSNIIVTAPEKTVSTIEMVPGTGQIVYSDNSVDFSIEYLGNAIEQEGKYFIVAGTLKSNNVMKGVVNTVDKVTGKVIYQFYTSDGTVASDVQLNSNGNLVIVEKDIKTGNSRVIVVDEESNVIFQYISQNTRSIQDVRILESGNMMISS